MFARVLPHPWLTATVAAVWLLLVNEVSAGHVALGLAIGVLVPMFTGIYWPCRVRLRSPAAIVGYGLLVLWDICVSNIQVARLVLFRRGDSLRSCFVTIPLDLRSPEAISVFAGTITMTPGTVSADLSADGRSLLVHCLEADDPDDVVAQAKDRYERRLKEIFEE